MTFFRISSMRAPVLRQAAAIRTPGFQRSLQSCRVLAVGKESALHEEGRAEEVEAKKQEQIAKAKQGKGEWHEDLASDSESIVKADKGETEINADTIKDLQKESARLAEKEKKQS